MAQESERRKPAEDEPAAEAKPAKPGKGGGLAGGIAGYAIQFVLMVGAVLVGGMISAKLHGGAPAELPAAESAAPAAGKDAAKGKAAARKAVSAPARYFALDPPLVVNLSDNGAVRYLQVNVEVMARDEKVIQSVQQNVPLIRNDLVQLLSDRPPPELMSREGREKMRVEALSAVNAILDREAGGARVESLLFTGFVVQ